MTTVKDQDSASVCSVLEKDEDVILKQLCPPFFLCLFSV